MNKSAFPAPGVDGLIAALAKSGIQLSPDVLSAVGARLDLLLFRRPGWWRAWQASAMSGRELRDALLQHAHLAAEKLTKGRIAFDQFTALETPFELALFGAPLAENEPKPRSGQA